MSSINDKAIFKELHAICFFFFSLLNTEDCFSLSARTKCATAHFHHHRYNGKKKLCNNMKTEKEKILNQNETIYSLLVSFHNGIFTSSLRFAFSFSPKIEIERWNFISDYQNYCITETERFFFSQLYTELNHNHFSLVTESDSARLMCWFFFCWCIRPFIAQYWNQTFLVEHKIIIFIFKRPKLSFNMNKKQKK